MSLKDGLLVALAGTAAPAAATLWWMLVDRISAEQALAGPIPYVLFAVSWFLATPFYIAASGWLRGSLWRLLLLATFAAAPFAVAALRHFHPPRDLFAAFLILSTAWVAGATFWGVLRANGADALDAI